MLHMDSLPLKSNLVKFVALPKEIEEKTVAPEGIVMLTLFEFVSRMPTRQRTLFRLVTRPFSGSLVVHMSAILFSFVFPVGFRSH